MKTIDLEIFNNYQKDLAQLMNFFTGSDELRTKEIVSNLEKYIEDGTAIVGGHIIDNELSSFIWCHERKFGGTTRLHIAYFIVSEKHRGKGLSKKLISFAKTEATKRNIDYLDLNVDPNNYKAINIYENSGFETEKLQLKLNINGGEN